MTIRVAKPGLSTTIQDRGRFGFAHLGISPAGAADSLSMRIANLLVGNDQYAPALEMTLLGATLEFEETATIALTGAACECSVGTDRIPMNTAVELRAGSVLQCGSMISGARSYLAVQGGLDVPLIMNSASTDVRGGFGGYDGRRLKSGDILKVRNGVGKQTRALRAGALEALSHSEPIRVTPGAQQEWFGTHTCTKFVTSAYVVSEQSDRAGLRLRGESLVPREPAQLLTDGIPLGAIQVPPDGQPIILFVDQQTTGGYPKIASVIAADMHRIGQLRPRDEVRFSAISISEAIEVLRAQEPWLRELFLA